MNEHLHQGSPRQDFGGHILEKQKTRLVILVYHKVAPSFKMFWDVLSTL